MKVFNAVKLWNCSHHCLSKEWVIFLSLSSEKSCHCLLSANPEQLLAERDDIGYDLRDFTDENEMITLWVRDTMAVFIRNENYINFNIFWPDQVDNDHVSVVICQSWFSFQKVSTPDRRHVGFQRVATSELQSGPRDYRQLWQNAIKQQIILGRYWEGEHGKSRDVKIDISGRMEQENARRV